MSEVDKIKKDVNGRIGTMVGTLWGPCKVIGVSKDEGGNDIVVLSEDGELFNVKLMEWTSILQ